jgi:hypothetical protein
MPQRSAVRGTGERAREKDRIMRLFTSLILAASLIAPVHAEGLHRTSGGQRPSVAATQSVQFLGKAFTLKFKAADKPVRVYEYYPADQTPDDWLELVEFQIYPARATGNEPVDYAKRLVAAFKRRYPYMQFAMYADERSGAAMLDFFFPGSTRHREGKAFVEFDAFKFFRAADGRVISFHYAKNVESVSNSRPMSLVAAELRETRQEVEPALSRFEPYRP